MAKGVEVSSPRLVVPSKNSTLAILPSKSVALAVMEIDSPSLNDALLFGEVMETLGLELPDEETTISTSSREEY